MKFVPEWLLGRMHRLKVAAQDAKRAAEEASTTLSTLSKQLDDAKAHLANATVPSGEQRQEVGERVEKRRKELTEQISALEPQVEQQKQIADRATEYEIAVSAVYERCQSWIDSGQHGDDDELEAVDIALPQGDPTVRLREVEAEIAALAEERERINVAPTARVDVERQLREFLDDLKRDAEPKISIVHGKVDVEFAKTGRKVDLVGFPGRRVTPEALLSLLLWLDGDVIEQKLLAIIDRFPISKDALPADVKKRRLQEIESKRTAALFEMGALVRSCIETGTPVPISKALEAKYILGVRTRPALAVVA